MSKWAQLSSALSAEEALLGSRLRPERLQNQMEVGFGWVIEEAGIIVACTFLWQTPAAGWEELGTVWSSPNLRGAGLAARTFRSATECIQEKQLNAFLITHNPRIVHLAQQAEWIEATQRTWKSVPWTASCGLCDRWPNDEAKKVCPYRADPECRMFFITDKSQL